MDDPRKTFGDALRDLARLYGDLAAVLEEQTQAMVKRDLERVRSLTQAEERIHENVRIAEARRERYLAAIGRDIGVETAGMGLREVAEIVGGRFRGEYLRLRERLHEVSQRIARKNKLKTLLCRESLDHIQKVVSLLGGADTGTYTPRGARNGGAGQLLIDRKV